MTKRSTVTSKELYEVLIEAQNEVGQGLLIHEKGRLLYANEVCSQITGYDIEELEALPSVFDLVVPEERPALVEPAQRRIGGEVVERYETTLMHKSGRWVEVEVVVKPLKVGDRERLVVLLRDITERKRLEEERLRTSEEYEKMIRVLPNIVFRWKRGDDGKAYPTYVEGALAEEFGVTTERVVGKPLEELFLPEFHEIALPAFERAFAGETVEFLTQIGDRWFANVAMPFRSDGRFSPRELAPADEIVGFVTEVTNRRRAEEELRESEERFRSLVQNASDIIAVLDGDGTVRYESPAVERVLGYRPEEKVGTNALDHVHPEDLERMKRSLAQGLNTVGTTGKQFEFRSRHADGSWVCLEAVGTNLLGNPSVAGIVVNARDVTERKALEKQLEHQAFHDGLTDLPNRALFEDRLGHALALTERRGGEIAVLFVDLDNFKFVNDSLGHHVGDDLLVEVSGLLRACLRPADTVARLGGDEFAVLLEDVEGAGEAERVAGRIVEGLRAPLALGDGQEVFITPSIGIALGGPDQDRPEDLLRKADVAMYRAKEEGKARHRVFDPGMEPRVTQRLSLENDLRRALQRDELKVHYQPVIRLQTGLIIGMEALVRWEHPERGLLSPDKFVPLAEEIGLIVPIGRRVLREACRQAREWQERCPSVPPLVIGVNISPRQLRHPALVGDVEEALRESGLDPEQLTLEITESAVVEDEEHGMDALRKLREMGVRFALDDFGTGYSSLSYLKRLPVGLLKIDGSFVERLGRETEDEVLLSGVVGIASGLGLYVLAEGVENPEQLARVKALGCEFAQGEHFSGPLPAGAAGELLAKYGHRGSPAQRGEAEA